MVDKEQPKKPFREEGFFHFEILFLKSYNFKCLPRMWLIIIPIMMFLWKGINFFIYLTLIQASKTVKSFYKNPLNPTSWIATKTKYRTIRIVPSVREILFRLKEKIKNKAKIKKLKRAVNQIENLFSKTKG